MLAIAGKLSRNRLEPLDASDIDEIARIAKLQYIEHCAIALLQCAKSISPVDIESGALAKDIPADATKDAISGAFWLMSVYEQLNAFRLIFSESGWTLKSQKAMKRKRGQYFTPGNLTRLATRSALNKLLEVKFNSAQICPDEVKALTIVDPAMGAGAFLICALEFLVDKVADLSVQDVAASCLYGVDLDPLAADVTYVVIAMFCSLKMQCSQILSIPDLKNHLKTGNSLVGIWSEKANQIPGGDLAIFGKESFHWQLEFPEVFLKGGFDVVLSNPPWETLKPNAREFFSDYDSNYKAIGLLQHEFEQEKLIEKSSVLADRWLFEKEHFDGFSQYLRSSVKRANEIKTRCGINVPFKAQGSSDLNAYKLFVELSFCLLAKNGCMSLIVPSGVYTDHGTRALRELLFEEADVFEITSYLNKDQTFAIHPSFNFCVLSVCNRKSNGQINVSFGNQNASSATTETLIKSSYTVADVYAFSPMWRSLPEVNDARELQILRKIYSNLKPLAQIAVEDGAQIKFKREFDLTNHSAYFVSRAQAQNDGYVCDSYGNFLRGKWIDASDSHPLEEGLIFARDARSYIRVEEVDGVLLPLYEGRMLGQFDCRQKAHIEGSGRTAVWKTNPTDSALIQPQYLLPLDLAQKRSDLNSVKIGYLAVGSATNVRTMIAAALSGMPCGNSVPVLTAGLKIEQNLCLLACLNSFVFDFVLRSKMTGNNINFYLLQDCPLPDLDFLSANLEIVSIAAALSFKHRRFARELLRVSNNCMVPNELFMLGRAKLRAILDALMAQTYGLSYDEFAWILRDESALPKGFWRVDKAIEPSLRHTNMALSIYGDLLEVGNAEFFRSFKTQSSWDESTLALLKVDAYNLNAIYAKDLLLSRPLPQIHR